MQNLIRLIACAIVLSLPAAQAKQFVYVSLAGDQCIAVYTLDDASGNLTPHSRVDVSGGPGALCVDPERKYLFASIRSVGSLASFRINDDGSLMPLSEVPAGADPAYVATDRSGEYLFSAYYRAGKVMVHAVDPSGKLSQEATQSIPTADKAHAIVSDRSGQFVFVPHTGPNVIHQFRFDAKLGKLAANDPAKVMRPEQSGPRHLWFHPRADFAYGSDEQGNSITAYRLDAQGRLDPLQTLSSLPPQEIAAGKSTSDIEVHPTGKFVYIANRGHDSISCYAIDQATGKMRYFANTKTEKTPRSFNIDPAGRHLIAAGQNSATLACYKIQPDGTLDPVGKTSTGANPWWVLIVRR
jgi:6-phosphogluconolactonase